MGDGDAAGSCCRIESSSSVPPVERLEKGSLAPVGIAAIMMMISVATICYCGAIVVGLYLLGGSMVVQ